MTEFPIVIARLNGSAATKDGKYAIMNLVDPQGDWLKLHIPSEIGITAAIGLAVASDAALALRNSAARPIIHSSSTRIGVSTGLEPGQCTQTMFLPGGGKISFQYDRKAAETLLLELTAFLKDTQPEPESAAH